MRNTGLDEVQTGIKIAGRNINKLRYADNILPYGRKRKKTPKQTNEPIDESERGE